MLHSRERGEKKVTSEFYILRKRTFPFRRFESRAVFPTANTVGREYSRILATDEQIC